MDNPVKIGIIGLGRAGYTMHTGELSTRQDKFTLVAGCDVLPARANRFAEQFGAKAYTRAEDLIRDPNVELVDIATFSRDHFEHAKMALAAGKNVFLEKPFALGTRQAEELIRLGCQPSGPKLYIRHNRRFEYGFQMVREIIDSGILGDVFQIKLTRNGYQRRNDWQTLKAFGGGQICNWGPHIIDHALQFCGGDYTEMFSDLQHAAWMGDRDDHIKLVFKGINRRVVDMEISGAAALPTPEYIVYGSKGALVSENGGFRLRYLDPDVELAPAKVTAGAWGAEADNDSPEAVQKKAWKAFTNPEVLPWKEEFRPLPQGDDGSPRIWDALYETLRHGIPFPVTLEQSYKVIRVIEEARRGTIFE